MVSLAYAVQPVMITNPDGSVVGAVAKEKRSILGTGVVYAFPCKVLSINVFGDTAGDYVGIYDMSGTPINNQYNLELEIGIAVANTSTFYDAKGAPFNNGVYVMATDATHTVTTVVFDY